MGRELGQLMFSRPYIAIIDGTGKIRFIDEELNDYKNFLKEFVSKNFSLLEIGDHSLPIGGVSLAFFKPAPSFLVVIHSKKGPTGQLLSFKKIMYNYSTKIEELIGEIELPIKKIKIVEENIEEEKKEIVEQPKEEKLKLKSAPKSQRVPFLLKKLGKQKFKIETSRILELCDGSHSITNICNETNYPKLKVEMTLRKYESKGWIKFKRVII
jgi:hypothetical protein